jgi:ribosomal protein L32
LEDKLDRYNYLINCCREGSLTIDEQYWFQLSQKIFPTSNDYYLHLLATSAISIQTADRAWRRVKTAKSRLRKKLRQEELEDAAARAAGLESCPICYKYCQMTTTKCGHHICEECLVTWLKKSDTCPLCRQGVIC